MCFAHSGTPSEALHVQAGIGPAAAATFAALGEGGGLSTVDVAGSGTPDAVAAPTGDRILDGYGRVLHNRWNRDLEPAVTVRQGEEIQLLCRDALDIGDQARTLTPDGSMTLDLGRIHPMTGPVHVEGAEPGDILEVEIVDVSPLVDFGYTTVSPALGLFGTLRPDAMAQFAPWMEAAQLSDPAAVSAVRDMIDWLVTDQQVSMHEAYALCSVAGDLKISELVDLPNWLVSMTLPRGIFDGADS